MSIKIPLFWALFPITIPILLVRIALATACAIVCWPVNVVSFVEEIPSRLRGFGWKTSYKVLSKEAVKGTRREVLITPGWILRLGGLHSRIVTIWQFQKWCYSNGHEVHYSFVRIIRHAEELAEEQADEEKMIRERLEKIKLAG